jgi:hypothetical protein
MRAHTYFLEGFKAIIFFWSGITWTHTIHTLHTHTTCIHMCARLYTCKEEIGGKFSEKKIERKGVTSGFEPWWVAYHWTGLQLDHKPSGWAIGLNRSFSSVCSVLKNFGLRKTTTDRWTSKTETDVFGFRFNRLDVRFPPNFSICPCHSSAPSTLAHVSPNKPRTNEN